jgi:hypothetical protein
MPPDNESKKGRPMPAIDPVIGRIRVPGPVIYVFPLVIGGGVSFVSETGGFGVAELVDEPIGGAAVDR